MTAHQIHLHSASLATVVGTLKEHSFTFSEINEEVAIISR
jgi:hypothetical protein